MNKYYLRAPDEVDSTWTLAQMEAQVTNAQTHGGWVILTYHHICSPIGSAAATAAGPVRRVTDLDAELPHADLVILMQDHSGYDLDRITRQAPLILDTRGRTTGPNVEIL